MGTKIIEVGSTAGGIARVDYKTEGGTTVFGFDDTTQEITGTAVSTTGTANKVAKRDANGAITNTKYFVSALNTPPISPTDTGITGEIRFSAGGIYICVATNNWRKAIGTRILSETITGLTNVFTNGTLEAVNGSNKYIWQITSGGNQCAIESTHNFFPGNNILTLFTGATVQTVTANSVYSVRIGNSVLEIRIDTGTGAASYRIASGTITEITVSRTQQTLIW